MCSRRSSASASGRSGRARRARRVARAAYPCAHRLAQAGAEGEQTDQEVGPAKAAPRRVRVAVQGRGKADDPRYEFGVADSQAQRHEAAEGVGADHHGRVGGAEMAQGLCHQVGVVIGPVAGGYIHGAPEPGQVGHDHHGFGSQLVVGGAPVLPGGEHPVQQDRCGEALAENPHGEDLRVEPACRRRPGHGGGRSGGTARRSRQEADRSRHGGPPEDAARSQIGGHPRRAKERCSVVTRRTSNQVFTTSTATVRWTVRSWRSR